MKNTLFLFLVMVMISVVVFNSCDQKKSTGNKAVIEGTYFPYDEYIFLNRVTANNVEMLDSAELSQGEKFSFGINTNEFAIYRLAHKGLYPLMVVVRGGDTVEIQQTDDKAWPYKVKGSDECMLLVNYLEQLNRDHYKVDSLSAIFHQSQDHPDFLAIRDYLNKEFIKLHEGHKEYARQFVSTHPSSLASIIVINGFFKDFALFNSREEFNYYELVDEALMERMPDNKHVMDFHEQVANIRASNEYELEAKMRLSPGRLIPDFELPTKSGEMTGPQDYRDRILLVYFWAGADAKSRQTNPLIKSAYDAYSKYGFEVLAISFDKDPDVWESAIKLDELPGVHLTDLKGIRSPVQKLFNLKMQLPAYFLVDGRGRIFDHDRDFSKLQGRIIELYNQKPDY